MLVVRLPSAQERKRLGSSQDIREVVSGELDESDRQSVVYLGNGIIGFKDAPTLPDQAADQAFDAVAEAFGSRLGIDKSLIDGMSPSDVEAYLLDRYDEEQAKVDAEMAELFDQY